MGIVVCAWPTTRSKLRARIPAHARAGTCLHLIRTFLPKRSLHVISIIVAGGAPAAGRFVPCVPTKIRNNTRRVIIIPFRSKLGSAGSSCTSPAGACRRACLARDLRARS